MLILTLIVKNESRIIRRCIESVLPYIHGVVLCDTGSVDDTVKIVEKVADENPSVTFYIEHHEWVSFGHNRSLSFDAAQKHFGKRKDIYCLLLDADMKLVVNDTKVLSDEYLQQGDHAGYLLQQRNGGTVYNNIRLIRLSDEWKCLYPTHEYWSCSGKQSLLNPTNIYIDDVNDGGAKADKFERDLRLLSGYLQDHPNDERCLFYIAQTYLCLNKFEEAILNYQKRCDVGGWEEECYYSMYQIGNIYNDGRYNKRDWKKAVKFWKKAMKIIPKRLEAACNLAQIYREHNYSLQAYLWSQYCFDLRENYDMNGLFVNIQVYQTRIPFEMAMSAHYANDMMRGAIACDISSAFRSLQWNEMVNVTANRRLYSGYLFPSQLIETYTSDKLKTGEWSPMNPSIIVNQDEVILNIRFVNYKVTNTVDGIFYNRHDIRTNNLLVKHWTPGYNMNDIAKRVEYATMIHAPHESNHIQGYEDVRLFTAQNKLYGLATVYEKHQGNKIHCIMANEDMTEWIPSTSSRLVVHPSLDFTFASCEKNWLPLQQNNDITRIPIMYHWDGICSLEMKVKEDMYIVMQHHKQHEKTNYVLEGQHMSLTNARGSCGGIPWDNHDEYLFILHFVGMEHKKRWYYQRFVVLKFIENQAPVLCQVSNLFKFSSEPIEIPSITTCPWDASTLILALGVNDNHVEMRYIQKDHIKKILHSVEIE